MSKRMQVLVEERELEQMQRIARLNGLTLAAWVRQVLRRACRDESAIDPQRKRAVIRRAARHAFPTPSPEELLAEIERGYLGDDA